MSPRPATPTPPIARKPPARETDVRAGVTCEKNTATLFSGKKKRQAVAQIVGQVVESTVLFWGTVRDPEIRAKVRSQIRRMRRDKKKRYDPRLATRVIAKRLHIPEIAVDEILQSSIPEYEEWREEIRAGIARAFAAADAKAEAVWRKIA